MRSSGSSLLACACPLSGCIPGSTGNCKKSRRLLFQLHGKAFLPYNELRGFSMATLTVTAKGQITLKQELLRHLNVTPGQRVQAEKLPNGRILVKAAERAGSIDSFIGSLE